MSKRPRKSNRELPAHWALFFEQKGIRSANHLAEITGIPGMTINRMVYGSTRTSPEILRRVAQALRVDDAVIYGLAGWPQETQPWEPPAEAEAMTERQRKAVTDMIRAFVQPGLAEAPKRAQEDKGGTVHQLRPADEGQEHHGLAAWRRDEGDQPTYQDHLDGLGEEPQDH